MEITKDLPALTGSPKQINWATDIRQSWLDSLTRYQEEATEDYPVSEKTIRNLNKLLSNFTCSSFWINTRDEIKWISSERFQEYSLFSGLFEESVATLKSLSK